MPADRSPPPDETLGADERGFVLAAMLLDAPGAADRLAGDDRTRCQAALDVLAALPKEARAERLSALRAELLAPVPPGIADVHPHWLRPALLAESSATLRAAVPGLPTPVVEMAAAILAARGDDPLPDGAADDADPIVRALRRAIFGGFAAADASTPGTDDLLEHIVRRGAETIGTSLRGAPRPVIARAAAQVGEPAAAIVLEAASRGGPPGERLAARQRVAAMATDDARLGAAITIGVYETAESLAGQREEAALVIAQRLPHAVGTLLLQAAARARQRRARSVLEIDAGAR